MTLDFTAVCQHRVELCQGGCAADASKGNDWLGANRWFVHRTHRMQPLGGGEGPPLQSARSRQVRIKLLGHGSFASFGGVNRCDALIQFVRQTDPEIDAQWLREV